MTEDEKEIRRSVARLEDEYGDTPIVVIADIKLLLKEIDELRAIIREQDHRISCMRLEHA